MERKKELILWSSLLALILLAWAPWITDDYAISKVMEYLGGGENRFNYLGTEMALKEVPKMVSWIPFGRAVVFPSEAVWFVTFWGGVY